ncbi:unnamed protein product [Lymnaea stagnalis]|uniref:Alpha/beta hydrolase fold-3 domain-containing protein n=1 Tax=Lymnaea stagnalis TaxID=6523 RepID=A0AAV2HAY2_LYMST
MKAMFNVYLPFIPDAASNPRVNPSARVDLEASPPTLIVLAQLDPLRDWGVAYAKKLRDAGVRVEEVIFEGVPHGFFTMLEFPKNLSKAHDVVAKFVGSFQ